MSNPEATEGRFCNGCKARGDVFSRLGICRFVVEVRGNDTEIHIVDDHAKLRGPSYSADVGDTDNQELAALMNGLSTEDMRALEARTKGRIAICEGPEPSTGACPAFGYDTVVEDAREITSLQDRPE